MSKNLASLLEEIYFSFVLSSPFLFLLCLFVHFSLLLSFFCFFHIGRGSAKSPTTEETLPAERLSNAIREESTENGSDDPFRFLLSSSHTSRWQGKQSLQYAMPSLHRHLPPSSAAHAARILGLSAARSRQPQRESTVAEPW